MIHDVYVFGDSHWRVFFPFVNHAVTTGIHNAVKHEQTSADGVTVRTIDTTGNGLSGSTMWGLLNPASRHCARKTILATLDSVGGVDNVGLVFGEVDARYHSDRYMVPGKDMISGGRVLELVGRYVRFVQEDLILTGRVRENVFVYHGFSYPKCEHTLLQPGQPIGQKFLQAEEVNHYVKESLSTAFMCTPKVTTILPQNKIYDMVSADGVHLEPKTVYEKYTFPAMASRFYGGPQKTREIPF
jgi:hypothetical protein